MKVLLLNHEFPPIGGGAANVSAHLSEALVYLGCRVSVVTAAGEELPGRECRAGVSVYRVGPQRRTALEASARELVGFAAAAYKLSGRLISEDPPDILHAFFGIPSGAVCWRLNRSTGLPYLISFRGRDVHGGKSKESKGIGGWMKAVSRPVWRSAAALVANSDGLRAIALDVDPSVHVSVIPNGVDTNRFSPGPARDAEAQVSLLYVGRLEPYKGLQDLLEALRILQSPGRRVNLTIAGDGSLRTQLPEQAERMGLADRVCFLGAVPPDTIPDLYRDADAFVLPSYVEGMPNVVLEAMASGLPVVATRIPGSEELVSEGQTGLLVEPASPVALAEALADIILDADRRIRFGNAARKAAEQRSWAAVAEAYVEQDQCVTEGARLCAASAAS